MSIDGIEMPNTTLQDVRLSPASLGFLVWLVANPGSHDVKSLAYRSRCGRDKVYRVINELISTGYIDRSMVRGDDGTFSHLDFTVSKEPTR
jgi:predicted transcriptional regulator